MTYPLDSKVFSSETLVAGCDMVASGGLLPETNEDGLLEEIERLEVLMMLYVFGQNFYSGNQT